MQTGSYASRSNSAIAATATHLITLFVHTDSFAMLFKI
jgi:hypothetical protein